MSSNEAHSRPCAQAVMRHFGRQHSLFTRLISSSDGKGTLAEHAEGSLFKYATVAKQEANCQKYNSNDKLSDINLSAYSQLPIH